MALTSEQLTTLNENWGAVIKLIYPAIIIIPTPILADDTLSKMLARWNHPTLAAPTEALVESTFLTNVYPSILAAETDHQALKDDAAASILMTRTPLEVYTLAQNQIDGWTSLADAKADLYAWLPVIGAAIAYLWQSQENE